MGLLFGLGSLLEAEPKDDEEYQNFRQKALRTKWNEPSRW